MNRKFWRGRRVLVTGHTGFKGAWLTLLLNRMGADVTGMSLDPPTSPSLFEVAGVAESCRNLRGDVRDRDAVGSALDASGAEVVLHLAAQSLVGTSYNDPVETFSVNAIGTAMVLDAVRRHPHVKSIVVVTSDKCYENQGWVWGYRENEPMGGYDPYSASKGCAELVTASMRKSFFGVDGTANIASARAGNVIGGGDWAKDRLIPDVLKAWQSGQPAVLRNPEATRPWQHVLDPLLGYLMLAEKLMVGGDEFAEGWNFGPNEGDVLMVRQIVEAMAQSYPSASGWQQDPGFHPYEAHLLKLDCTKAHVVLGWSPLIPLNTALQWIVGWTRDFATGSDMRLTTDMQIDRFLELAAHG